MKFQLPFGNGAQGLDTGARSSEALCPLPVSAARANGIDIVRQALEKPIDSPALHQLAHGKKNAVIIISDHTRPVPSRDILPPVLQALRAGSPDIEITLLVATGFHRATTREELCQKLGSEILESERVVVHDSTDSANLVNIGTLPSGAPLVINRIAAETQLLLAEGFIEPHFFAGFSGGRKSVLPGICGRQTVLGNHCASFISSANARAGVLDGNPIHGDMLAAAQMAKLAFIANVAIDEEQRTVAAFAGHALRAHEAGCAWLGQYCRVRPTKKGDIVISTNGGAPLDQNLYQAVKGLSTAEAAAAKSAVLILCAECADGTGGEDFYLALRNCERPERLLESILHVPMGDTEPDQWQTQILARILTKHKVIMVTTPAMEHTVREMKMGWAPTAQSAWEMATTQKPNGHTLVIPNGVSVVIDDSE